MKQERAALEDVPKAVATSIWLEGDGDGLLRDAVREYAETHPLDEMLVERLVEAGLTKKLFGRSVVRDVARLVYIGVAEAFLAELQDWQNEWNTDVLDPKESHRTVWPLIREEVRFVRVAFDIEDNRRREWEGLVWVDALVSYLFLLHVRDDQIAWSVVEDWTVLKIREVISLRFTKSPE